MKSCLWSTIGAPSGAFIHRYPGSHTILSFPILLQTCKLNRDCVYSGTEVTARDTVVIRNISNTPNELSDFCTLLSELSTMAQDDAFSLVYGRSILDLQ